jgi:Astacin (Peptidase family M12A)
MKGQGMTDLANPPAEQLFCSALDIVPEALHGERSRVALLKAAFWGMRPTLTVSFFAGTPDLQRRVAKLAQGWVEESRADITFNFWIDDPDSAKSADIRIDFQKGKGSWSHLGRYAQTLAPTAATMNLGWMTMELDEVRARAVVLHEFGHALGLIHEHTNPKHPIQWNETAVIADLKKTQGWDEAKIRANMFAKFKVDDVEATAVDPLSIMMYPIPSTWTKDGFTAPFNSVLTAADKKLVREQYGERAAFGQPTQPRG